MKNKEQLVEEYIEYLYGEEKDEPMYTPEVCQSRQDFQAGYNSAIQKWIKVEDKKPEYNKPVLLKYIKGKQEVITQGYFQDEALEIAKRQLKSAQERNKFSENGIETVEFWRRNGRGETWFDYADRQIQYLGAKTSKNKVILWQEIPQ